MGERLLTRAQREQLGIALRSPLGVVERPHLRSGLASASWDRMMVRLEQAGYVTPYVHGGYEITDAGRTALSPTSASASSSGGE
jgi:hypothetical protein